MEGKGSPPPGPPNRTGGPRPASSLKPRARTATQQSRKTATHFFFFGRDLTIGQEAQRAPQKNTYPAHFFLRHPLQGASNYHLPRIKANTSVCKNETRESPKKEGGGRGGSY
jgi:hypothetical protein